MSNAWPPHACAHMCMCPHMWTYIHYTHTHTHNFGNGNLRCYCQRQEKSTMLPFWVLRIEVSSSYIGCDWLTTELCFQPRPRYLTWLLPLSALACGAKQSCFLRDVCLAIYKCVYASTFQLGFPRWQGGQLLETLTLDFCTHSAVGRWQWNGRWKKCLFSLLVPCWGGLPLQSSVECLQLLI